MSEATAQTRRGASGWLVNRGDGKDVPVDEVVHSVLADVSEAAVQDFVRAADGPQRLEATLWGEQPTAAQAHELALASLAAEFELRRALLAASVTTGEAAGLLGVSEQAVLERLGGQSLLGMKQGRSWRLPLWQFHAGTQDGYLPGLKQLQEAHPGSLIALSRWATRPHPRLQGRTPAQELADGHTEVVLQLARSSTAAAW